MGLCTQHSALTGHICAPCTCPCPRQLPGACKPRVASALPEVPLSKFPFPFAFDPALLHCCCSGPRHLSWIPPVWKPRISRNQSAGPRPGTSATCNGSQSRWGLVVNQPPRVGRGWSNTSYQIPPSINTVSNRSIVAACIASGSVAVRSITSQYHGHGHAPELGSLQFNCKQWQTEEKTGQEPLSCIGRDTGPGY